MIIDTQQLFSSSQRLPSLGDAVSQRIDTSYLGNLTAAERPYLHVQTVAAAPRSAGTSVLEVALLHSDDGQHFVWAFSPIEGMEVTRGKPWAITPTRLPAGLQRFLLLRYRVTGDPLTAGALTAFLSADAGDEPLRMRRQNITAQHDYYPSGFSFPPGYNSPGNYERNAS